MGHFDAFQRLFFKDFDPGEFPFKFSAEATNRCNLHCMTCPRQESGRGYGDMTIDLFTSLADQAAGRRNVLFYPQGFGESFMHPRYFEMLRYVKRVGVRHPIVITNGSHLSEDNCRALIDAAPRGVVISLDGGDKKVFEEIRRHADYDAIVEGVKRLFRIREEAGARRPAILLGVIGLPSVLPTVESLRAQWKPYIRHRDDIFVCTPVSWAGTFEYPGMVAPSDPATRPAAPEVRPPCRYLYKSMTVFYDGRVTPCCCDHACRLGVGNANEQSVAEIWNGERVQALRRLHEEGRTDEIPLCGECNEYI